MNNENKDRLWEREMESWSRTNQAAREILTVAVRLGLTMAEFDQAVETVRHIAVLGNGKD